MEALPIAGNAMLELAAEAISLTEGMVPTSIARLALPFELYHDRIHPVVRSLAEGAGNDPGKVKARLEVQALLEMGPSAIALVVAPAEIAERSAKYSNRHKQNYRRTFRWVLFHWLASAYFNSFGMPPQIYDDIREPEGAREQMGCHSRNCV
jgi:hypothetical protein